MNFIYLCLVFLLGSSFKFTNAINENNSNSRTSPWSKIKQNEFISNFIYFFFLKDCSLKSKHQLKGRNLSNFYFSSCSLCTNDYRLLVNQKIDETTYDAKVIAEMSKLSSLVWYMLET